ncbi:MAG: replication-associated recombination protein A [Christensenellales bacterium]
MDNFNLFGDTKKYAPLADRVRPTTLDEFVGQEHIVKKGGVIEKAIKNGTLGSCIFYGPPGTGKTTLANIIANTSGAIFKKLNAISSGVGDAKEVIAEAKTNLQLYGKRTYLLLDECHRWNKAQSDSVLEAVENGSIIFIGSTTENPYTSMTRAIVSRCRVFEFKPLSKNDVKLAVLNAISSKKGLADLNVDIKPDALDYLAFATGGDVRKALNTLELASTTGRLVDGKIVIDKNLICDCLEQKIMSLDENEYYDMLSAFCKSIRGSDADSALFYAFRMIESGVDPLIVCRRLIAHCSEDIGMANSNALVVAVSAMTAYQNMGVPEGLIPLTHAIIYACESPKSNSVIVARNLAMADAQNLKTVTIPNALKNHPSTNDDGTGSYKYPHDFGGYVYQQYMPKELEGKIYYTPSKNGDEKDMKRKKVFDKNKN